MWVKKFTETELYWNPETGNFDLYGPYPTWSLSIAMLSAFAIIFPANIALVVKLHKEHKFRRSNSDQSKLHDEDENPGCAPILRTIDLKMTIVLIGISIPFILLTIPHRFLVVYATLKDMRIEELPVAITRQFCHINFSCNSIFYFFLASECREELKKTCPCCLKWFESTIQYLIINKNIIPDLLYKRWMKKRLLFGTSQQSARLRETQGLSFKRDDFKVRNGYFQTSVCCLK